MGKAPPLWCGTLFTTRWEGLPPVLVQRPLPCAPSERRRMALRNTLSQPTPQPRPSCVTAQTMPWRPFASCWLVVPALAIALLGAQGASATQVRCEGHRFEAQNRPAPKPL